MTDDAFPRSSRPPHGQDAVDRRDPASDPLMELARLIGQSDPFGTPPARSTDLPRTPELPTRGPMARPPSRSTAPRDIAPRDMAPPAERYEEEQPYEPRPARSHPFPSLRLPPLAPTEAAAESRKPSYSERPYEEPSHREAAYREPPPHTEPPFSEAPTPPPSYGQPAPGGYDRYEPTFVAHDPAGQQHGHQGHAAGAYPTVPDQQYAPAHYAAEAEAEPARGHDASGHEDHYPRLDDRQHHTAHPQDGQHGEHDPRYAAAEHDPRYAAAAHDKQGEYDPRYAEEGEDAEYDPRYAAAAAAEEDQYDDEYEYADEDGYADEEPKRRNLVKIALAGGLGLVVLGTAGAFGYRAMFHGGSDGPPPLIRADNTPTKVVPTPTADASAKSISDRLGSGERMVSREEQPIDLRDARNANGALVAPVGTGGVTPYPTAPTTTSAAPASTATAPAPTEPKRVRTVTIHADAGAQPNPAAGAAAAPAMPIQVTPPGTAAGTGTRAPTAPRPAASPAAAGNAPMSISPQSPPTVAAVDTTHPAPAKTTPSSGGGWIVQLSAQKSEAEAQAAFRTAQGKYSALADQQPLIRKKDQGERGVFYATQVGPFPQREEANKLCETLKGAGANCFIQKY
jgi:SPOR domain